MIEMIFGIFLSLPFNLLTKTGYFYDFSLQGDSGLITAFGSGIQLLDENFRELYFKEMENLFNIERIDKDVYVGGTCNTLFLLEVKDGEIVVRKTLRLADSIKAMLGKDKEVYVYASNDTLYRLNDSLEITESIHVKNGRCFSFYNKGVIFATKDGRIGIIEGKKIKMLSEVEGPVSALLIKDGMLYIGKEDRGIEVYRIRGKRLKKLKSVSVPGYIRNMIGYEDFIFIAAGWGDIKVLKVKKDTLIGSIPVPGEIMDLKIRYPWIFASTGFGMFRIKVLNIEGNKFRVERYYRTVGCFNRLIKVNDVILVGGDASSLVYTVKEDSVLFLGNLPPVKNVYRFYRKGKLVYILAKTNNFQTLRIDYLLNELKERAPLFPVRSSEALPARPLDIAFVADTAVVALGEKGVELYWVCPCGPIEKRGIVPETNPVFSVASKEHVVYLGESNGLKVVELGSGVVEEIYFVPLSWHPLQLIVFKDKLIAADSTGGVKIFSIRNPLRPRLIKTLDIKSPEEIKVREGNLYVLKDNEIYTYSLQSYRLIAEKKIFDKKEIRDFEPYNDKILYLTPYEFGYISLKESR